MIIQIAYAEMPDEAAKAIISALRAAEMMADGENPNWCKLAKLGAIAWHAATKDE